MMIASLRATAMIAPQDVYLPDLRLGSGIVPGQATEGRKVKMRDFGE